MSARKWQSGNLKISILNNLICLEEWWENKFLSSKKLLIARCNCNDVLLFHKQVKRERSMVRCIWTYGDNVSYNMEKIYSFLYKRNNSPRPAPHSPPWQRRNLRPVVAGPRQFSSKDGNKHLSCNRGCAWPGYQCDAIIRAKAQRC